MSDVPRRRLIIAAFIALALSGIERLRREPQISSASAYMDRATAERVVAAALESDNRAFASWRARTGPRPNFVLRYLADRVIGRSVMRGASQSIACDRAVVVVRWDERRQPPSSEAPIALQTVES